MSAPEQVLLCLAVAAVCGGIVRALPVPLPLLQIAAGALLAWCGLELALEPDSFLLIFVAPLLFIDGFRIPKRELRRFRATILMMAFGLVVLTVLVVGTVIAWCLPDMPPPVAFAIAAALSPTDAVAVSGITGRTKVPPALMHVWSGEALMNDASGLVCLRVAVATIATGTFSWAHAAGSLAVVAIGGSVVGALVTYVFARVVRLVFGTSDEEGGPRTLIIILLPFAAYLAAESVHCSGILAAVAAGILSLRFEIIDVNHRLSRRHTRAVLGMMEVGLNGLVFVLLGLQLPGIVRHAHATAVSAGLESTTPVVRTILLASAAMFAVRFVWVWLAIRFTIFKRRWRGESFVNAPLRVVIATALAGVRGAVSLAAALTIPLAVTDVTIDEYPAREVAISLAAGVILLSLAAASIGLPLVLKGVELPEDESREGEEAAARGALMEAAIAAVTVARDERIQQSPADESLVSEAANAVLDRYRARGAVEEDGSPARALAQERELRAIGVRAERETLQKLSRERKVDEALFRRLLGELDAADEFVSPPPAVSRPSH